MAKTETLKATLPVRAWLPPLDGGTLVMAVLIGLMGFYVLYPLVLILINSFNTATIAEPPVYGLRAWREAFSEPGIWRSLWNSVKIGIVLQIVALPLGIFLSWLISRTNILFANAFELQIELDRVVGAGTHGSFFSPGYFDSGDISVCGWVNRQAINVPFLEWLAAEVKCRRV